MNKEGIIVKHGEEGYKKYRVRCALWGMTHPEAVRANKQKHSRKGGEYYERQLEYNRTWLRRGRKEVRNRHAKAWYVFKNIIAPLSQIHHEWIPGTADYRGVALVEADQHMHGIVDVIEVLSGEITLLTEEEIRGEK